MYNFLCQNIRNIYHPQKEHFGLEILVAYEVF